MRSDRKNDDSVKDEREDDGCGNNDYDDDKLMMQMVADLRMSRGLIKLIGRGL